MMKLTDEDESSLLLSFVQAHVISHIAHARTMLIQTFSQAKVSFSFSNTIPVTQASCKVVEIQDRCELVYLAYL